MRINRLFLILLFYLVILFLVFRFFFLFRPIAGGDYITFWPENITYWRNFSFMSWDGNINLGWDNLPLLHYAFYSQIFGLMGGLVKNNIIILERIFWWIPFFAISIFSIIFLFRKLFPQNNFWFITPLIFVFNTYVLMIIGGGQVGGIGLAYAIAPLVLACFVNSIKEISLKWSILSGIVLALQIMFDPRITYITIGVIFFYALFWCGRAFKKYLFIFSVPLLISFGLHFFWIFPMLATGFLPAEGLSVFGEAYTSVEAVKFFSFASFSNAISLLHPNWPENIFGKVGFMKPEFLVLPILVFSSLLFLNSKLKTQMSKLQLKTKNFKKNITMEQSNNGTILFFALLALIGAFLAKGANPPFGGVYLWLFEHVPGFIMFRDPTKFYLLAALSYSVLIPYSLFGLGNWVSSKLKAQSSKLQLKSQNYLILAFIVYWLFLIKPAWLGELGGTFRVREVPEEYVQLKDFIISQPEFFRTFWIPKRQRFGFFSNNHPAIEAMDVLKVSSPDAVVDWLKREEAKEQLSRWAVKYIIVPYDSEGEIFLEDRRYSEKEYQKIVEEVGEIQWLREVDCSIVPLVHCPGEAPFGKIVVFQMSEHKDRFFINELSGLRVNGLIKWEMISPVKYKVELKNINEPFILVFSESFEKGWVTGIKEEKAENIKIYSRRTEDNLNSFEIEPALFSAAGEMISLEVFYEPQRYVNYGLIISGLTLLGIVLTLILVIL